jgi:hypothetical protein
MTSFVVLHIVCDSIICMTKSFAQRAKNESNKSLCATNLHNKYYFEVRNDTDDMGCRYCSFSNPMKGDDEP